MTGERSAKGPRNRPRARLVCTNCRSKKIKCDAEKLLQGSQCTPCRASKSICHVDPESDRRRHGATHHRFTEMQERIRSLEAMIKPQSSAEPAQPVLEEMEHQPQPARERNQSPRSPHDTIVVAQSAQHMPSPPRDISTPDWRISDPNAPTYVSHSPEVGQDVHMPIPDLPTCPPSASFSPLRSSVTHEVREHVNENIRSTPTHVVGVANQVSGTLDVTDIEQDNTRVPIYCHPSTGEVAFYGSTTQSHLHSPNDEDHDVEMGMDGQITDLSMNMNSVQLRKALLDTFFKVQPCSQIIVHEELFRRDRAYSTPGKRSRYYSDFLESAMLASAARHSTSAAVRVLVKRYGERAKNQISLELDNPNIATLQGFLILSDLEATRGRARTGWTYCNIAASLIVDLAIHVEPSEFDRRGSATPLEAQFRADLLLGTFVYDTLWSLYLGRPSSISPPVLLVIRRIAESYSNDNTLYMWVQLCLRMLDIIEVLNTPSSAKQLDTNHEANLRLAFNGLPANLMLEDDAHIEELEASAYTPHLQYLGIQITVHRAIVTAEPSTDIPGNPEHLHTAIHDNAVRIAKLVLSYQRIFGTENMVTVMLDNIYVAAVALMSHILRSQTNYRSGSGSADSDVRWLRFLHEALESVEKHFPIARRMRSSLEQMIKKTSLVTYFPNMVPITPPANILPSTFTNPLPHNQITQNGGSEFPELSLTFPNEDVMWAHYLAWNMPFMPTVHDPS